MRTELRILTGRHAGARVLLDSQQLTIGLDNEVDVQITDWSGDTIVLELEDANVFYSTDLTNSNTSKKLFPLLSAQRFGSVVLCIGPADEPWPSELSLLQAMIIPTSTKAMTSPRQKSDRPQLATVKRPWHVPLFARFALLSICAASLVAWHGWPKTQEKMPPDPQLLLDRLQMTLLQSGFSDIHAHRDGQDIIINGFVRNREDYSRLQQWLDAHPGRWREHVYDANAIAEAMYEALGDQSLRVDYVNHGVFRITGTTSNSNAIKQRIAQISTDFSDQITGIQLAINTIDPQRQLPRNYASALAQRSLYYVETPDGTKHFNFQSDITR